MKKIIIFLVCCLSAASIHPMKRQRGVNPGKEPKRQKVRCPGSQQEALQNNFLLLPLDMLVIILKNALGQATTREGYVGYVQQYSKLLQVCKFWNNVLKNQIPDTNLADLNPLNTPYAKNLIAHKDDSYIEGLLATRLHMAAIIGNVVDAMILIKVRADLNAQDTGGRTPLHCAAIIGYTKIAKLLIEKGANVDAQDKNGYTPLHCAAIEGYTKIAKLLIENGADVNARIDDAKWTPLHGAAQYGQIKIAKLLIENGAEMDTQDELGRTPLHMAARYGQINIAKLLIKKGADIDAQDKWGNTPLNLAEINGHTETANLLREAIAKEAQAYDNLIAWLDAFGT